MNAVIFNPSVYNVNNSSWLEARGSFYVKPVERNKDNRQRWIGFFRLLGHKESSITLSQSSKSWTPLHFVSSQLHNNNNRLQFSSVLSDITRSITSTTDSPLVLNDASAVYDFTKTHPEVNSYISRAIDVIKKHFPGDDVLVDIKQDPDSTSGFQEMFLYIQTNKPAAEATRLFNKVDDDVFGDGSVDTSIFNVSLGFVS